LQETNDNTRLTEIQRLFSLDDFSAEDQRKEVEKYLQIIEDEFEGDPVERMREARLLTFEGSPDYRSWIDSTQSRLLILSGRNEEGHWNADYCWLSPIAVNWIIRLQHPASAGVLAYFLLQRRELSVHDVLPPILLQLLRQKGQALRDEKQYMELLVDLRKYKVLHLETNKKSEYDKSLLALQELATRVIHLFDESETPYIIVDRVDRCSGSHRKGLLKILVGMTEAARCNLKVLVVSNTYDWQVERYGDEFGETKKGTVIVQTEVQRRPSVAY
jgi:hypothetical protein